MIGRVSVTTAATVRTDIQALRGLAILLVVMYHAKLLPLPGGYLGVDVFFVISGYLITSLIARGIQADTFSFAHFYYRRARRLLPAAYVTLAVCIALSPYLLTSIEMHDFVMQVLGTVTFTGNMVLWRQTGYFEGAAELKPLLHVWSLAIEEQYYMLLPAVLVFVRQRYWLPLVAIATTLSFGLYVWLGSTMPVATFYLFPTRAWELGIGSIIALAAFDQKKVEKLLRYLTFPAGFALLLVPVFPVGGKSHPEIDALLICLAAAVIVVGNYPSFNSHIATRILAKVGDISYSLYLVHWPIFAFLNNANAGGGGLWWPVRLGGLLLSFVLAYLLYSQIEQRFRLTGSQPVSRKHGVGMALLALLLMVAAFAIERNSRSVGDYVQRLRANVGFSIKCESQGDFSALPECRNSEKPTMVVWGDSFAMHLVPGIASTPGAQVMQATRSTCAPLLGYAIYSPPEFGREWVQDCIKFNQDVLDTIAAMPSVEVVVLAQGSYPLGGQVLTKADDKLVERTASVDLASSHLRETVFALRRAGKRVVVIEPPPSQGFDIGRCIERSNERKFMFGTPVDCRIPLTEYEKRTINTSEYLRKIGDGGYVSVYSFRGVLCDATHCNTRLDDKIIYRDAGHLSYEGSIALARKTGLVSELERLAR